MIGVFRWGYGADFKSIAFWGWVDEGVDRAGFIHSIVAGRPACLIARDMERRREVLGRCTVKSVSAQAFKNTASPRTGKTKISGDRRKSALCPAGSVFKTEATRTVQKTVAQVSRPKAADIKTSQAVAESGAETKITKR